MSAPATETPGQKAARERRERRQAKMDGGARLDKITQLNGRAPETGKSSLVVVCRPLRSRHSFDHDCILRKLYHGNH
jgi:hypothetical protein